MCKQALVTDSEDDIVKLSIAVHIVEGREPILAGTGDLDYGRLLGRVCRRRGFLPLGKRRRVPMGGGLAFMGYLWQVRRLLEGRERLASRP